MISGKVALNLCVLLGVHLACGEAACKHWWTKACQWIQPRNQTQQHVDEEDQQANILVIGHHEANQENLH